MLLLAVSGCGVSVTSDPLGAAVELVRYDMTTNPQAIRNFDGPRGEVEQRFLGLAPTTISSWDTDGLDSGQWRVRVHAPDHLAEVLPLRAGEDEGELHVQLAPE